MNSLAVRNLDHNSPWARGHHWDWEVDKLFTDLEKIIYPNFTEKNKNSNPNLFYKTYENESNHLIYLDIPGVQKKDIVIEVSDGVLAVSAKRLEDPSFGENKNYRASYRELKKSFVLPKGIEREKIKAKLENGVLSLNLPKKEESKPKKIEIEVEQNNFLHKFLKPKKTEVKKVVNST